MGKRIVRIHASTNRVGSHDYDDIYSLEEGEELDEDLERELIEQYACNVCDVWLEVVEED